jgi:uncharacterized protein (DUF427 family)
MKKLITLTIIGVLASIVFSSCGSKMSLTKRHYNKGYHFAHSNSKRSLPKSDVEEKLVENKTNKQLYSARNFSTQVSVKENSDKIAVKNDNGVFASNDKKTGSEKTKQSVNHNIKFKAISADKPVTQIKQSLFKINKTSSHADGDGLSLFWIIILVLLILWALGYSLGALGGLIHILLVIALILFILWLLHIV